MGLYTLQALIAIVVLAAFAPSSFGASPPFDLTDVPVTQLRMPEDPLGLPYRFHWAYEFAGRDDPAVRIKRMFIPLLLEPPNRYGLASIQNNWIDADTVSSIIFHEDMSSGNILSQDNRPALQIDSYWPANVDSDPAEELGVAYRRGDQLWLAWVHHRKESIDSQMVATVRDRDGNGFWDGIIYIVGMRDITGDGHPETFLAVDVGYDLYDRELMAVDTHNDTILWRFRYSGSPGRRVDFLERGDPDSLLIVLAVSSKGNQIAPQNGMNDNHSYVIALYPDGRPAWIHEAGGLFTNCFPSPIDFDDDGDLEIFIAYREEKEHIDNTTSHFGTEFRVLELDGSVVGRRSIGPDTTIRNAYLADVAGDAVPEVVISFTDHRVIVCDQRLRPLRQVVFGSEFDILATGDFLGNGERQLLLTTNTSNTLLVDEDFTPLAWHDETAQREYTTPYRSADGSRLQLVMPTNGGQRTLLAGFRANPWTSVFFRKPWLASLVVFFPMTLVVALVLYAWLAMRRRNRVIDAQRGKLSATLVELRETQAQLVAAEKFRTAKDIAGAFAHEIRNALVPLEIAHRKIRRGVADDESLKGSFRNADRAVQRALELTNLISTYVRTGHETETEPVELGAVVRNVAADLQVRLQEGGIGLETVGNESLTVQFNREAAMIVVTNLLANAIDALDGSESGAIVVQFEVEREAGVLRVRDNGKGIDEALLPRVFDPFVSTKPKDGHGLGLSIVKQAVEAYGGTVTARNADGGGAEFVVTLPLVE